MTPGILLAIVGTWVVAQVLAGDALGRLGITGNAPPFPSPAGAARDAAGNVAAGAVRAGSDVLRTPIEIVADIARRVN